MKRAGFTLTELLVVIVLTANVAVILSPVFSRAREKSRQIACAANEKQIGVALMEYLQDNDGALPDRWYGSHPAADAAGQAVHDGDQWYATPASQLDPYLKTRRVWVCPSKRLGAPDPLQVRPPALSYGFNGIGFFGSDAGGKPVAYASIASPAQTVAVAETGASGDPYSAAYLDGYFNATSYPVDCLGATGNQRFQAQTPTHFAKVNLLYGDGHVELRAIQDLRWGAFYGVTQTGQAPFGASAANDMDARGDYAGPNHFWTGGCRRGEAQWYQAMAPAAHG